MYRLAGRPRRGRCLFADERAAYCQTAVTPPCTQWLRRQSIRPRWTRRPKKPATLRRPRRPYSPPRRPHDGARNLRWNPGWRVHPVFHISLLEPYREDGRIQPPPPSIEMEGALEYEVESIFEHRFRVIKNPKAYYKVAWKGYGIEHNSWEPESNVVNAPETVADYWKRQAEEQAGLGALMQA
jgi:hypothetical protein